MSDSGGLPAVSPGLPSWAISIPKALIPASLKAVDRLIGAAVDVPVAYLKRTTAKIDAQTKSFQVVEEAIARVAAAEAGGDPEVVQRAVDVLLRKEYRKQRNRDAIAAEAIEQISGVTDHANESPPETVMDDDWLNIFQRYAEDASTERMQKLWGRVLAGEIRKPGRFSFRTLRFLSEFSQSDAEHFAAFAQHAIGDIAPVDLVKGKDEDDIRHLLQLEEAGLITGASGGLSVTITLNESGYSFLKEGNLVIILKGKPGRSFQFHIISVTVLGQEVLQLIPNRDPRSIMRSVASAIRKPGMASAHIGHVTSNGTVNFVDVLWDDDNSQADTVASHQPL